MNALAKLWEQRRLALENSQLQIPQLGPRPLPISAIRPSACSQACPAGIRVKSYVSLIAEERFDEALRVVREHCPLPGVCGRVCDHPCEDACQRGEVDAPIAIRALKRFVADCEREFAIEAPRPDVERGVRVAIVGSGPAGLSAAWDLRREGYGVTIFESETEPGGMLRHGIADYRLPPDVLDHEIDYILRTGIELRSGVRIGKDLELESLLSRGFRAVLLATGAQIGRRLGMAQEGSLPAVEDALAFLRRVNAGSNDRLQGRVIVIGGGSTAIEAARAALRLGALSSQILYRRSQAEMPASEEEIEAARAEGVEFSFLVAPKRLIRRKGRLGGLECLRSKLGATDESGRPKPMPIPNSEFVVEAEHLFAAIGQEVDLSFLPAPSRDRLSDGRGLYVDRESCATRLAGVFAAGDLVTGPSTVIQAIATGHRAAASIRSFLEGIAPAIPQRVGGQILYEIPDGSPARAARIEPPTRTFDPEHAFAEVEMALSRADAVAEARRCLRCGPCDECRICAPGCGRRHIALRDGARDGSRRHAVIRASASVALSLEGDEPVDGALLSCGDVGRQGTRALPIEAVALRARVHPAECRGCESCIAVCPFDAIRSEDNGRSVRFARINPARCRGCNLCTAVCPTSAARATVFSPDHWDSISNSAAQRKRPARARTVLLCEHRAESLASSFDKTHGGFELLRIRCLGQLEAGLLIDLFQQGARRVVVGGCSEESCRFSYGSAMAGEVIANARDYLSAIGRDPAELDFVRASAEALELAGCPT